MQKIELNKITVISGDTGCGKSTQVPKFIYQHAKANNKRVKVLCTQPRRIACESIAKRIASEMGTEIGQEIGFHFSKKFRVTKETAIVFVTNGMFLNYLVYNPTVLNTYSHVIIDEVHERDIDADLILILLKTMITSFPKLKIILMSATINSEMFANYFSKTEIESCHIIHDDIFKLNATYPEDENAKEEFEGKKNIDDYDQSDWLRGKTEPRAVIDGWGDTSSNLDIKSQFKVETKQSIPEEVFGFGVSQTEQQKLIRTQQMASRQSDKMKIQKDAAQIYEIPTKSSFIVNEVYIDDLLKKFCNFKTIGRLLDRKALEGLMNHNYSKGKAYLIIEAVFAAASLINFLDENNDQVPNMRRNGNGPGTVLVFLPGLNEIYIFIEILRKALKRGQKLHKLKIVPLHSTLSDTNEAEVFASSHLRKVIVSTNIAESSLTIPDVHYVIDFCLSKQTIFKARAGIHKLDLAWASKASMKQRQGRTGRTCDGYVFKMLPRQFYNSLDEYPEPEMLRTPLDKIILRISLLYNRMMQSVAYSDPSSSHNSSRMVFEEGEEQKKVQMQISQATGIINQGEGKNIFEKLKGVFSSPAQVLGRAIDKPKSDQIRFSVRFLEENGCFIIEDESELKGKITFFGNLYSGLPCSVEIAKLLLFSKIAGCLKQMVIIAAFELNPKSIFRGNSKNFKRDNVDFIQIMDRYADGQECDQIVSYNIYCDWYQRFGNSKDFGFISNQGRSRGGHNDYDEQTFHRKLFLRPRAMLEIHSSVRDLWKRAAAYFPELSSELEIPITNNPEEKSQMHQKIRICLASAFVDNTVICENNLLKKQLWDITYMKTDLKIVPEHSVIMSLTGLNKFIKVEEELNDNLDFPLRTKYSSIPKNQIIHLWRENMKQIISEKYGEVKSVFYHSGEFFIEFSQENAYFSIKSFLYSKWVEESHSRARVFSVRDGSHTRDVFKDHELVRIEQEEMEERQRHNMEGVNKAKTRSPLSLNSPKTQQILIELKKDINKEASLLGSIVYHYSPECLSFFEMSRVSVTKESINKILLSGGVQKAINCTEQQLYYLSASQKSVGQSQRVLVGRTFLLPLVPMFPTFLVMLLGNNCQFNYDNNEKRIKGIRYLGQDIDFENWVEEETLILINRLRRGLRERFISKVHDKGDKEFWKTYESLLLHFPKTMQKMVHPDQWYMSYKKERGEFIQKEPNNLNKLLAEENFFSDDEDSEDITQQRLLNASKVEQINRDEAGLKHEFQVKNNFKIPNNIDRGSHIDLNSTKKVRTGSKKDINFHSILQKQRSKFLKALTLRQDEPTFSIIDQIKRGKDFLQWKHEVIDSLIRNQELVEVPKARICCNDCGSRIIDLTYLEVTSIKEQFRMLHSKGRPNLIELTEREVEKTSPGSLEIVKNYFDEIIGKNKSEDEKLKWRIIGFKGCLNGHFMGIQIESTAKQLNNGVFFSHLAKVHIVLPDLEKIKVPNLVTLNKQKILEMETIAISKKNRFLTKPWHCKVCQSEHKFKMMESMLKHFLSKPHIENLRQFVKGLGQLDVNIMNKLKLFEE